MSYVVFARKYRPLCFADMVGQDHIARTLGNAIAQDRVHHAYLFAGARGLGKTTTARVFAKGLVCERGPTAEPCNACTQCNAVNEGHSVDVLEIDGASNNSVDNIRNLREQVHYLPQTARRKVYIIDEVHMLSTSAFNALLKTLEEPPPHVNFVFATTEPHKVLATILSRVNRLDFHRVSVELLVDHLEGILRREKSAVDPGGLRIIARAAGGSVRDSLTLLDQVIAFADDSSNVTEAEVRTLLGRADRVAIAELVDAILERDPAETMRRFDSLVTGGHDVTVLSMQLLEHLRDLTVLRVCETRDVLPDATDGEVEALRAQSERVDGAWLGQLFDRFSRVIDRLQTSRMQRMLVEMGLLDLASSEPVIPLGDLVDRLNGVAPGGGGAAGGARGQTGRSGAAAPRRTSGGTRTAEAVPATPAPIREPEAEQAAPAPIAEATEAPVQATPTPAPTTEVRVQAPAAPAAKFSDDSFAGQLWNMGRGALAGAGATGSEGHGGSAETPAPSNRAPTNGAAIATQPALSPQALGPAIAGPCEPRPAADGTIAWEQLEPFAAWEVLLGRVRNDDEFQCAVLEQVALLELAGGALQIAAPRGSFAHTELSKHPERRAQLEQAMRDHFGAPFSVQLVEGDASLPERPSLVLVQQQRREVHRAEIEAEARSHPALTRLVETFSGQLTRVRPLHEP